ncbi:cysteine desulfurase [Hugenholtzia roseola]|uniref:cysteine desulfurase n=1 Tax=Hugenholtzia roseola TaxID=1002 RepID=UPI001FE18695|nr:cysteine desulfurase [Hugenholtzia roseola]
MMKLANPTPIFTALDIEKIRAEFPILHQKINGKPLIYFDNAATAQKPKVVIEALKAYYENDNANVHRGAHTLAARATEAFEKTRKIAARFLNAAFEEEIIFVRGVTEGINLIAQAWGSANLRKNDEILISTLEHHSNIVPWQLVAEKTGAILKVIPINEKGEIIEAEFEKLLSKKTKILSIVHVSNALGTVNPIGKMIQKAKQFGTKVIVDGAQATPHFAIDVQKLDCDFYVFSGHKVYAPTGIGVLYGKKEILDQMQPYHGGGEMIKEVTFEKTTYNHLPHKFEAGTPNIADTIGLGRALEFLQQFDKQAVIEYESRLLTKATALLSAIEGVRLIGTAAEKASVLSFVVEGVSGFDLGMMLDANGVAVRVGHHCTQPLMKRLGIPAGTVRASFALYNTEKEIEDFAAILQKILPILR